MLQEIGKVVAIVNEDMVLVSASRALDEDSLIVAFVRYTVKISETEPSNREIIIPKGTLNVLMDEGDGLYLVERYREMRQQVVNPNHWLGLGVETVQGDWSATIAAVGPRGSASRMIRVGDLIGVEA